MKIGISNLGLESLQILEEADPLDAALKLSE